MFKLVCSKCGNSLNINNKNSTYVNNGKIKIHAGVTSSYGCHFISVECKCKNRIVLEQNCYDEE